MEALRSSSRHCLSSQPPQALALRRGTCGRVRPSSTCSQSASVYQPWATTSFTQLLRGDAIINDSIAPRVRRLYTLRRLTHFRNVRERVGERSAVHRRLLALSDPHLLAGGQNQRSRLDCTMTGIIIDIGRTTVRSLSRRLAIFQNANSPMLRCKFHISTRFTYGARVFFAFFVALLRHVAIHPGYYSRRYHRWTV
ncbi:hypothetical protein FKP32DRAFT_423096 [Trametes sanguinea]|nr:hypothetical protein FKP32DRAFT_423096 [Trametes sanguinea]